MDRLGVRKQSTKKGSTSKMPVKVVYIANPKMVTASAADFRALVQELTGNINASSGRTITAPPPICLPDENCMISPSQDTEIVSPGVINSPAAATIGSDDEQPLSADSDFYLTDLSFEDLILEPIRLEGSTVFESHGAFAGQLVNYEPIWS